MCKAAFPVKERTGTPVPSKQLLIFFKTPLLGLLEPEGLSGPLDPERDIGASAKRCGFPRGRLRKHV